MSNDGIQLSNELMHGLFDALVTHDAGVEKDLMLGMQYLAAVIGYFAAEYPGSVKDRNELLEQLAGFTQHVADDRANSMQKEQPQQAAPETPKGKSVATDDPAVGIWKPELH